MRAVLLLAAALVAGCETHAKPENFALAERLCEPNGGIKRLWIRAGWLTQADCLNGVLITPSESVSR